MSVEATSKVFQGGKTQLPAKVRRELGIRDGDTIVYVKRADGYLIKRTMFRAMFSATLQRGGITCPKCGHTYDANMPRCPSCRAPRP